MLKAMVKKAIRRVGFDIVRYPRRQPEARLPPDFDNVAIEIIQRVRPFTMTSNERIYALIEANRYVLRANIPGSIVEYDVGTGYDKHAALCER